MREKRERNKKIVVAMSGGIDSSVAAALLKRAGFNIVGVFMKFWAAPSADGLIGRWNRCCSPEAEKRARKVAQILNIPFYVLNFEKEFKKKVVDYFLREHRKSRTPNPCPVCNKKIKFGLLLEKALNLRADFVATGHYARKREIKYEAKDKNLICDKIARSQDFVTKIKSYKLLRAKDREKDQSYFLWQLNQKQLRHILFPIGDYTKKEVRGLAKRYHLPVSDVPESQEICFVQATVNDFLKQHLKLKPGKIVTPEGKVIGEHQGLFFYTIGQRKGLGLPGGPYYVLAKNLKKNILIVTKNEKDLEKKELTASNVNWISGQSPKLPLKIKAKIRSRIEAVPATIYHPKPNIYHLKFGRPQRAITPGQSVVFYKDKEVLGGGIITKGLKPDVKHNNVGF